MLNDDDDDDAKALPTGVPKDDAMKKGGWGVKMSPKVMASYLYVPLLHLTVDLCTISIKSNLQAAL